MIVVGGVGELFQGDLDVGRRAAERLAGMDLGSHVLVEDFHYGAIAVTQRLEDLAPDALVLVGAAPRGRPPGTVERRRIEPAAVEPASFREAVELAGTGTVSIDLVIEVAAGFGALPDRIVSVEVEPEVVAPTDRLSPGAERGLEQAVALVRTQVDRIPLLELVGQARSEVGSGRIEPSPALAVMKRLLTDLELLDREGRWGAAFALKDELRLRIAAGETGEGMEHLDWTQWWGVIEELDRLEAAEAS